MQQDLKCRKHIRISGVGHKFYHHKSERSATRSYFFLSASITPTFFSSPSQRNGDAELLGYGSELHPVFEDGVTDAKTCKLSAMSVEYRVSFGKGNVHQRMHVVAAMLP
ncbi:hypothetical protein CEXT_465381 [Caerostris extrusa]|uniref:Uncharacterized protein n=1 Tax=Caerostris extrusa TaxID=172846 RepID=A0AAV4PQK9_CAEEX|nr:hypothetical protein CEXT_465381 [Caerostris extrusa]